MSLSASLSGADVHTWIVVMYTFGRVTVAALCLLVTGGIASAESIYQCEAEASYHEFLEERENYTSSARDFTCFKDLESVNVDDFMIVDVRPADQYRKFRIPHSINLSSKALLSTSALRSKNLLVLNKGFQLSELAKLCAESKRRGFSKLIVLSEGISGWSAAGRPLEGDPQHLDEVNTVNAEEFLAGWQQGEISVLATAFFSSFFAKHSPKDLRVSWLDTKGNVERQLIRHLQKNSSSSLAARTVVISDSRDTASLPHLRNVFFLELNSAQSLFRAYDKLRLVASSRETVPNRFRCGG